MAGERKRTDEYGGSVPNSCRLALEIGESIRDHVGDAITVGIRLSLDEFVGEGGITQQVGEEQLDLLAASGLYDYFSISGGGYHAMHKAVSSMDSAEGFMVPFGKRAKEIVGDRARIFIVGRILDVEMADAIVAGGSADMVAMTRAQMAEPFLGEEEPRGVPGRDRSLHRRKRLSRPRFRAARSDVRDEPDRRPRAVLGRGDAPSGQTATPRTSSSWVVVPLV